MGQIRIAIVGGGPSALYVIKHFAESVGVEASIDIFERENFIGRGMPYSIRGARNEHITNLSSDELPALAETLAAWLQRQSKHYLSTHSVAPIPYQTHQPVPRLVFGDYLEAQFQILIHECRQRGIETRVHLRAEVIDIVTHDDTYGVQLSTQIHKGFTSVILCSGHMWPKVNEEKVPGYFDSPYPPDKLNGQFNHAIAIKGSSLTAIDAIKTLARANGQFVKGKSGRLRFAADPRVPHFKIVMHSLGGLLPTVGAYHEALAGSEIDVLKTAEVQQHMRENQGFISLAFMFERYFKDVLKRKDPHLYRTLAHFSLEEFVTLIVKSRKAINPFTLLKLEYLQAAQSIKYRRCVYWKEILAQFSFAINRPAKYLSAEDTQRYRQTVKPLISLVIADMPLSSAELLLTLQASGKLELVAVDTDSDVQINDNLDIVYHIHKEQNNIATTVYQTFVDCTGQKALSIDDFPFRRLLRSLSISIPTVRFKACERACKGHYPQSEGQASPTSDDCCLVLQGFAINDFYQMMNRNQDPIPGIFIMAVPFITGFNPDYSGLDFCNHAASLIVEKLTQSSANKTNFSLVKTLIV